MSTTREFADWERTLHEGTFEESQLALEEVVHRLELGKLPLDESIACYALGVQLASRCEKMLSDAELVVTTLDQREDLDSPGLSFPNAQFSDDDVPF
ncbi:MAG: exodeoxyribonuclease VII small subunit [Thermomicrobiales bacterium]